MKFALYIGGLAAAGGEERLLWEEEKAFKARGIETVILTLSADKSALFDYQPDKLEVIQGGRSRLSQVLALRRRLKQIKPDLVIASSNWSATPLYLATLFTSIPYAVHIHGTLFWFTTDLRKYALIHRRVFHEIRNSLAGHKEFIPARPRCGLKKRITLEFWAILDRLAVRKARKIITLTDQLKWEVRKLYGKDAVVARGCLPPEVLDYQPKQDVKQKLGLEGKRIILSIGRLDRRKRIDLLIRAFARIAPQYEDVYLAIGGVGEEEERLKSLAGELGITERAIFLGFIPDSELFDHYAAADVFAFPSWTSSGITPYEALAAGCKVVWTTEADEPVLKDSHVFLADPTVEDFARGLERAVKAQVDDKIDLSNYTWEKYFNSVYVATIEAVDNR